MANKENKLTKVMNVVNMIGSAILMNLLFLVSCLPIVTIGPAWSGLYSAVRFNIRGESWFVGFKYGFKTRFWRNTLLWSGGLVMGYLALNQALNYASYIAHEPENYVGGVIMLVLAGLFLAVVLMFTAAAIPVNLYIPTELNRWLQNTWYLVFHAPIYVLGTAALVWAPLALALFWTDIAFLLLVVFIAAYYALAAVAGTVLLKDGLVVLLLRERAENPEFEQ